MSQKESYRRETCNNIANDQGKCNAATTHEWTSEEFNDNNAC